MPPLLCLGCGENLTSGAADRGALQGPQAEGVVDAWKAVYENVQVDVDDDRLCAQTPMSCYTAPSTTYRRSGFNCEYPLIANCEFFQSSQSIDSQE